MVSLASIVRKVNITSVWVTSATVSSCTKAAYWAATAAAWNFLDDYLQHISWLEDIFFLLTTLQLSSDITVANYKIHGLVSQLKCWSSETKCCQATFAFIFIIPLLLLGIRSSWRDISRVHPVDYYLHLMPCTLDMLLSFESSISSQIKEHSHKNPYLMWSYLSIKETSQ